MFLDIGAHLATRCALCAHTYMYDFVFSHLTFNGGTLFHIALVSGYCLTCHKSTSAGPEDAGSYLCLVHSIHTLPVVRQNATVSTTNCLKLSNLSARAEYWLLVD